MYVDIQKKNGEWEQYVFKIDSGADTMLMEEGDRDSLGYALGDCITCKYTNANNDEIISSYPQFLYKNRRLYSSIMYLFVFLKSQLRIFY